MQKNTRDEKGNEQGQEVKAAPSQLEEVGNLPECYLRTADQILADRGTGGLRARNSMILGDLQELAKELKTNVSTRREGNRIFYSVDGTGIIINLINA